MAGGVVPDLRGFDRRLRQTIGPIFGRLRLAALATEHAPSCAVIAFALSGALQSSAIDAIAGRQEPFVLADTVPETGLAGYALAAPEVPTPSLGRVRITDRTGGPSAPGVAGSSAAALDVRQGDAGPWPRHYRRTFE